MKSTPDMDPVELERAIVSRSPGAWFELHGAIYDKERNIHRAPDLILNDMQQQLDEIVVWCGDNGVPCRIITLKGRQQGSSTWSVGALYHKLRVKSSKACIIGDLYERSVANLVAMFDLYATEDRIKWGGTYYAPGKKFSNGSELKTETANSPRAGASGTFQAVLATEVAHWKETDGAGGKKISAKAVFAALLNCVPKKAGTLVIVESTPNGASGVYYDTYQGAATFEQVRSGNTPAGWNGFIKVFYPWHQHPEYRNEVSLKQEQEIQASLSEREQELIAEHGLDMGRLAWRREKLAGPEFNHDESKLEEEYPSDEVRCLTADTRVGTSKGYVRISDVEVGSMSDHGKVVAKQMTGVKPVVLVTTKHGFTLRCTTNHRVAVGDGFVEAQDLIGKQITLQPPVLADHGKYHTVQWDGFAGVDHKLLINEDWGAFLGYFAGDGSFGGDCLSSVVDQRDQDVVERIAELTEMVVGRPPQRRLVGPNKGGEEIRISDKRLKEVFERLGVIQETRYSPTCLNITRKVCVPECIWKSPRSVVRQFLRYLFEADGWSSDTVCTIKFFTKYITFARDVQRLLMAFGIRGRIRHIVKTMNGKKFPGVDMQLCSVDAVKFMEEIGFVSARKNRTVAATKISHPGLLSRYNYNDEVVSVEPDGEEEVWDIQIEGSRPVFSANGILVHNCFLMSGRRALPMLALQAMKKKAELYGPGKLQLGVLQWTDVLENKVVYRVTGDDEAWVKIWEIPRPGLRYLLSVDPCTGAAHGDDPDNHGIGMWREGYWGNDGRWNPQALVARLADVFLEKIDAKKRARCMWDVTLASERVAMLSCYYGWATTVVEINKDAGFCVLLQQRPRMRLFVRMIPNRLEQTESKEYGWDTNAKTRGPIIEGLKTKIRHWEEIGGGIMIWDLPTISECMTMIVLPNGRAEAAGGCHDDQVLEAAIADACMGSAKAMPYPQLGGRFGSGQQPTGDMTYS